MKKLIGYLEVLNENIGKYVSWATVLLVAVISIDVILRYLFQFTYIWITEVETYLFGLIILLTSGYTFKHNKHVRVDVFYNKFTKKGKALINLIGGLFFLLPWCYVVIFSSWNYAYSSFIIKEGSAQPGGLPALYLLKFSIVLGFLFLLIQTIASILKAINTLLNSN